MSKSPKQNPNTLSQNPDSDDDNEENDKIGSHSEKNLIIPKKRKQYHEKIRDFEIIKELGQGSFGSVYLVEKENTKKHYAIKVINKDLLSRTERTEEALIERLILSKCRHPSICRLLLSFQSKYKLFFVLEYCPNKDLEVLLSKLCIFDDALALQIIAELVNVVEYLHNKMEISHNDLKPGNILLDEGFHIKLIDFSTSKIVGKVFDKKVGNFVDNENYISNDIIGTAEFVSPEMVNQNIKDYRTNDIWSLGVIMYIIFNGVSPFKGKNDFVTLDNVKKCKFKYENKNMNPDAKDLIDNILVEDTNKRFDIKKIKYHRYFKDVDWDKLLENKVPIDREQLEEINKQMIEKNNNENFWEQFCDDINNGNDVNNINQQEEDEGKFEINKFDDYPPPMNEDFFYSLENLPPDKAMKNISKMRQIEKSIKYFKDLCVYEGIAKRIGFFDEKEIKIKLYRDKRIEILDIEKNVVIKTIEIDNNTVVKIQNEKEVVIGNEKFRTTKIEAIRWYNNISKIVFS